MQRLAEILTRRGLVRTVDVHLITDLTPKILADGSSDLNALIWATEHFGRFTLTYMPSLHAKVLIADAHTALVSSANFTSGGSHLNREYGVRLREPSLVNRVADDIADYAKMGVAVNQEQLTAWQEPIRAMQESLQAIKKAARETIQNSPRQVDLSPVVPRLARPTSVDTFVDNKHAQYVEQEKTVADDLFHLRVRSRNSTNALFGDTITYLLARAPNSAMTTDQLHTQIQAIHPDLCDDSIDRVIDGKHYGKRWKHQVRGAQVTLQKRGRIIRETDTNLWRLITPNTH